MKEPTLATPIVCSLFAALSFSLAKIDRMPENLKYLFILVGTLLALWAFVTGGDWLINRGVIYLKQVKLGWVAGEVQIAQSIEHMRPDQLRAYERLSPSLATEVWLGRGSQPNRFWLRTSMGKLEYSWISSYLDECESHWPYLIPQHGKTDNIERDYIAWFTAEMVSKGLADPAAGNLPAKWVVSMRDIWNKFGFE